jgi:hypothetical protein
MTSKAITWEWRNGYLCGVLNGRFTKSVGVLDTRSTTATFWFKSYTDAPAWDTGCTDVEDAKRVAMAAFLLTRAQEAL